MEVLIVGAGAIGSLIGGRLAVSGHKVIFKDRPEVVERLKLDGFELVWPDGASQTVRPHAIVNLDELDSKTIDLVVVTVKSFDTAAAVADLVGRLSPHTRILSPQNGVGNEEFLLEKFPEQTILAGSVTLPVAVPEPGKIVVSKEKGGLGLAQVTQGAKVKDVREALLKAGFTVRSYADYRSLKWSKLAMNNICNAIPAVLDMPPGEALIDPRIFDLELDSMRETFAVMRAGGIPIIGLPSYPVPVLAFLLRLLPNAIMRRLLRPMLVGGRGTKLPSLQLDMRNGRNQSEVNVLNRVVAETGLAVGVDTPINAGVSKTLNEIIQGSVPWATYQGHPDVLCDTIQKLKN